MKLNSFKTLVLASSAFCATAAFAANQARVNVPFAFTAKGQTYPAGTYRVALNEQESMVTMENQMHPGKQISWVAGPADSRKAPAVVVFDEAGSDYALKTIQVGSRITPNLDKTSKHGVSATTSIAGQ
jgi:hypothetical protein